MTPRPSPGPERGAMRVSGRLLSFLDFGGPGRPLLALHGHFAEGRTFTRLAFDPKDMNASQQQLNGDHWDDWLVGDGPAPLVRGSRSTVLSAEQARDMAARRPRTRLVGLPAGHTVHETVPAEFAAATREFLSKL